MGFGRWVEMGWAQLGGAGVGLSWLGLSWSWMLWDCFAASPRLSRVTAWRKAPASGASEGFVRRWAVAKWVKTNTI